MRVFAVVVKMQEDFSDYYIFASILCAHNKNIVYLFI